MNVSEFLTLWKSGKKEFYEIDISNANLEDNDLSGISLIGANLKNCNLTKADLSLADLTMADLTGAILMETNLMGANLSGVIVKKASFLKANLKRSIIHESDFSEVDLLGADLTGADLTGLNLTKAIILQANLTKAILKKADLTEAKLTKSNLTRANFEGAILKRTMLNYTCLTKTIFKDADLEDAVLNNTNYEEADLIGVDLSKADLDGRKFSKKMLLEKEKTIPTIGSTFQKLSVVKKNIDLNGALVSASTESNLVQETKTYKPDISNQGLTYKADEQVYTWNNLRFRSQTEIKIAEALDKLNILYYANCKARLTNNGIRENKESDFLIFYEGKCGILEVDGDIAHPASRTVDDHKRDRLFKVHGIVVVEHYDAKHCWENPKSVVEEFLQILKLSK